MDTLVLICYVLLGSTPPLEKCHVEDAETARIGQWCVGVRNLERDILAAHNNETKWRLVTCEPYETAQDRREP